jgi:DNA processing protein
VFKVTPQEEDYPTALRQLEVPPTLTISGEPNLPASRVVAIVGSRRAEAPARGFAFALAYHLARANIVVVSGGAEGIDSAAHAGAMRGGAGTWVIACTGRGHVFPKQNHFLFDRIEASTTSRMIWPFPDRTPKDETTPRVRNGVLVALAECVVVVQAALKSGTRNSAAWARRLGRPIYVVPGMPWDPAFKGSVLEGAHGAQALWSIEWFFDKLELPPPDVDDPTAAWDDSPAPSTPIRPRRRLLETFGDPPLWPVDPSTWSSDEKVVFSKLSLAPIQQDTIIAKAGLTTSTTLTALLTLSLKDVVVEGPDGFFRRRISL